MALVHLDHQRVSPLAERAVAQGQLRKVRLDLEADGTAMTRSLVLLHRTSAHGSSRAAIFRGAGTNI